MAPCLADAPSAAANPVNGAKKPIFITPPAHEVKLNKNSTTIDKTKPLNFMPNLLYNKSLNLVKQTASTTLNTIRAARLDVLKPSSKGGETSAISKPVSFPLFTTK